MGRPFFKVWANPVLNSNFDNPASLGVFIKLLALCSIGNYHDKGLIKPLQDMGYEDFGIARMLKIKPEEWLTHKNALLKSKRITLLSDNIIRIVKWGDYQTEYERQKPYRDLKPINEIIQTIDIDKDIDIDIESKVTRKVTDKNITNYVTIFLVWNRYKVSHHLKLTPRMIKGMDKSLKLHPLKEVLLAIENYSKIVFSNKTYYKYRFTLDNFLLRDNDNVENFKDYEIAFNNYKKETTVDETRTYR